MAISNHQDDGKEDDASATDLASGLTQEEVRARLDKYGYNEVPEERTSGIIRFAKKFWGITPAMLEFTILLTWVLGNYIDSYIIIALLISNAIVSYYQEERADASLDFLRNKLKVMVRAKRSNSWALVPARELVPGDVIRLRSGDFAPADVLIKDGSVEVDQSSLTGESMAVERNKEGLIYSGSIVRRGEATGVVTKTGSNTYFGRTTELVQIARPKLHIEHVVSNLVKYLVTLVSILVVVSLALGSFRGESLLNALPLATILLVAAIPIALPTMFNITMALSSQEMAKRGIIVTRLSASEDAATMDVLCVDKTGTLTENKLSISAVVPLGSYTENDILLLGSLSSQEANQDPIDMAMLSAGREHGISIQGYVQKEFVPFSPSTRRTEALIRSDGGTFTAVKGALATLLPMARMSEDDVKSASSQAETLSAKGYRILAVARSKGDAFELAGLIALYDRPREDTPGILRELAALGISIKMLTGDSVLIARETAKTLGFGDRVVTATNLKNEQDRAKMTESSDVFAEVYPEDKYLIVKGLQKGGHVVGMTGDGVNDAPALKQAEVGIAVTNATDVAKQSASVVLSDCGLEGIALLIKAGRSVYQRILTWIMNKVVKTFQVVVFVILVYLWNGQYVVTVTSMILFLFLTDFVTLSLSTDRVRYSRSPENWKLNRLLQGSVLLGLLLVGESVFLIILGASLFDLFGDMSRMRMFAFCLLVVFSLFDVLILRERRMFWTSRPSMPLLISIIADLVLVAAISQVGFPGMAPIAPAALLLIFIFIAAVSFTINDLAKVRLLRDLNVP